MNPDLMLVSDVRSWLGLQSATDTDLVTRLVSAASSSMLSVLNQPTLNPTIYTERRNGNGLSIIVPRKQPMIAAYGVSINNNEVTESTSSSVRGWWADSNGMSINLNGMVFTYGNGNISLRYLSGYGASVAEPRTIASTVTVANASWYASDVSVVTSGAVILSKVSGVPASGQYSVNTTTGVYTFNAADAGTLVTITYLYRIIPDDIQQAGIELCLQKYRRRTHGDQVSQTLNGQLITFSQKDMPSEVKLVLESYKNRGFISG